MTENWIAYIPVGMTLLKAVIAIIFTVVALYVIIKYAIPWLKERKLYDTVKMAVRASEKLGESCTIDKEAKLQYVVTILQKKGIKVDATVRAMIESAVGDLDDELTHSMMSLVNAINNADDATEFFYTSGKVIPAELDSRGDTETDAIRKEEIDKIISNG